MILQALTLLTQELNAYLKASFQTPQTRAMLAAHTSPAGADLDNQMSVTLINVGSEPTVRNQQPSRSGSGPYQQQVPALKLNLRVLLGRPPAAAGLALQAAARWLRADWGHPYPARHAQPAGGY
jgi:hypothetical protein